MESLTYLTEEFKPYNYLDNGEPKGIAIDLVLSVWKQLGIPKQAIQFLPWPRAMEATLMDPNTVLFSTVKSPDREDKFIWAGPIAHSRTVLIARKDASEPLSSLDDLRGKVVGVIRDYPSETIVRRIDSGIRVDVSNSLKICVEKLDQGRIQFLSMEQDAFFKSINEIHKNASEYHVVWLLAETTSFFAFNKETDPHIVERFQKALDAIRK